MEYNFKDFLNDSERICKTKADFLSKIYSEEKMVLREDEGRFPIERQLYLRRLDNARFSIEKGVIKENDVYNIDLQNLLSILK